MACLLALLVAPPAPAQDNADPSVDQYVESVPTSRGRRAPAVSRDQRSVGLPRRARVEPATGADGETRAGTSVRVADASGGERRSQRSERERAGRSDLRRRPLPVHDTSVGTPGAPAAAAGAVGGGGGLMWLLLGLGAVTVAAVGGALVRQRRARP